MKKSYFFVSLNTRIYIKKMDGVHILHDTEGRQVFRLTSFPLCFQQLSSVRYLLFIRIPLFFCLIIRRNTKFLIDNGRLQHVCPSIIL
ncbi:hypothetical protein VT99_13203 [Candidatus Electrothrix marina]|uniref:Uncharacterized protein n=1 Tax=Candidatus Electrothrix marina TaxID=1859130 RepID=A0A444IU90_9BACT|nr:hypothetical protein VT99_13203 [Candidatus Electrothrix marina]